MITKKNIQVNNQMFEEVTISRKEIELSILNYGATVLALKVPNELDELENIVLSFSNKEDYLNNTSYLNAIIGPTSGRIKNALIHIKGQQYKLDQNFLSKHHLHGGKECFAFQSFKLHANEYADYSEIICSLQINDNDSYYPGNKDITITYKIEASKLTITFEGQSDQDTLLNMTSHMYFNLSAGHDNIHNHHLMIDADQLLSLNPEFIPTSFQDTKDTLLDVSKPVPIKSLLTDALLTSQTKGIDHPFVLKKQQAFDASLFDPNSKRLMQIKTTYPIIVCYSHNYPENKQLTNGTKNIPHQGVCFETQYTPNHEDFPNLDQPLLKANHPYLAQTIYTFSIKKES